ncbi:MAG: type II secretion system secretin GspD [Gammaproteobacteria bacterium]
MMMIMKKFAASVVIKSRLLGLTLLFSCLFSNLTFSETGITLNLKDADLQSFIETVAEITGKNFVIDPRVKAKVTVVSARPMDRREIYEVFLSVLQVHGFATVEVGEVIKILPDVNAKQGAGSVVTGSSGSKGDQLVTRVIQVNNVAAAQLVPILRPLVPQQGHLAAYPGSNMLVISDRGANIARLEKIIRKIDQPDAQEIEVVTLQHASASEVVQILNSLRAAGGQAAQTPGAPTLAADDRTNSILLSGDSASKVRIRGLIAHLDTPIEGTGNTKVVYLHYALAEEIAPILQGVSDFEASDNGSTPSTSGNNDINIQADATNNALIITAPPARFDSLRRVISQLDVRRAQVLVEAVIAEVSNDLTKELGAEGFLLPGGDDPSGPAASSINAGSILSLLSDGVTSGAALAGQGLSLGGADLNGGTQWGFLIRALEADASTNILSTPTLVTLDNEEAEIVVAQNVPFVTGQFTNTGSGTDSAVNPFQTIERQDVGLTLRITPQINEGNSVRLQIEQESSSISTSSVASDLITNERRISTSVMVDDNEILVLGGLTQDDYRDVVTKTPLLGDIPLVGNLFRSTSTTKTKQNLMVFIHPVILRDASSSNLATESKYDYLRARQLESKIEDRGLIKDNFARFPDLNDLVTQLPKQVKNPVKPASNNQLQPQAPSSSRQ